MNERLKELIEQSKCLSDGYNTGAVDLEKFAELIIGECIRLCDQVDVVGADECIDNIKEYFEIK